MKLQLTVFAQDLKAAVLSGGSTTRTVPADDGDDEEEEEFADDDDDDDSPDCHLFAVVAQVHPKDTKGGQTPQPTVLGKTEVLKNTYEPDFTKIFILNGDFELGKPMHVLVTLHDAKHGNRKVGSSATFDVGAVLGTKGGVLGKQIHAQGGYLMVHVERASGLGTLNLKLRGWNLTSAQEQVDPYFELQKKRKTANGETIWDVVFRSIPVPDTNNPIWSEVFVDLGILSGGKKKQKFRISIKDYDDRDDTLIGSCFVTVKGLLAAVTEGADDDSKDLNDLDLDNAIPLMRPRPLREVGKLVVVSASIGDAEEESTKEPDIVVEEETTSSGRSAPSAAEDDDEDIVLEPADDIAILPEDVDGGANFADYIAGGCQLRVIVAIDYTASNGDPRKEESLHHFKKDGGMNMYEETISKICSILSEYDSDQKFPVYGFGAKKGGSLSHCFPVLGDAEEEVEGVEGILSAYKGAFKMGIAMSKPTNITQVIKKAGEDAKQSLKNAASQQEGGGGQVYSILTIFTNGNVHSVEETIAALADVQDDPLSVVVVGVGPSDFTDMSFLKECREKGDDGAAAGMRVHFVDTKLHDEDQTLTEQTLSVIPAQLVRYFSSKGISPNPPVETDEIVIEPFQAEEEEGQQQQGDPANKPDIVVSENGDISVAAGEEANNNNNNNNTPSSTPGGVQLPAPIASMGGKGKTMILTQAKRQFGRISKQMERNMNRMIDQRVNKMFGIQNVTGGKKKRTNVKKR